MSELEIAIQRPRRWDEPFGEMTEREVTIDADKVKSTLGPILANEDLAKYIL